MIQGEYNHDGGGGNGIEFKRGRLWYATGGSGITHFDNVPFELYKAMKEYYGDCTEPKLDPDCRIVP